MDLTGILGKVAPWLAAAASGGPVGIATLAVSTLARSLGASDATEEAITKAVMGATPEQLNQLRRDEMAFQLRMRQLGHKELADLEAIAAGDRKDARAMQVANKSWIPAALSCAVTAGYFVILIGMMAGWLQVNDSQALLIMLGSLGTAWGMVMAFWFGSTRASEDKTRLLAQSPAVK